MEKEAARQIVQEQAVAPLKQPVTLVFKDKSWTINPAELGLGGRRCHGAGGV